MKTVWFMVIFSTHLSYVATASQSVEGIVVDSSICLLERAGCSYDTSDVYRVVNAITAKQEEYSALVGFLGSRARVRLVCFEYTTIAYRAISVHVPQGRRNFSANIFVEGVTDDGGFRAASSRFECSATGVSSGSSPRIVCDHGRLVSILPEEDYVGVILSVGVDLGAGLIEAKTRSIIQALEKARDEAEYRADQAEVCFRAAQADARRMRYIAGACAAGLVTTWLACLWKKK